LIEFGYGVMNDVMKVFKEEKLPQIESVFDLDSRISTLIRLSELNRITDSLQQIEGLKLIFEE
jgi:hypothetical protein